MDAENWTPEPWLVNSAYPQGPVDGSINHSRYIESDNGTVCQTTNKNANVERIVACVNACAGMSDPAGDIAALRRLVEAATAVLVAEPPRTRCIGDPQNDAMIALESALSLIPAPPSEVVPS